MNNQKYVIIGGSAAGMAAATAIRETDKKGMITVFSEEVENPYFRPMIPYIVSRKKTISEVSLVGEGPYQQSNIDVKTNERVASVDTGNTCVILENGSTVPYDQLLIATGSHPYIPPSIEGTDLEGVYALRNLSDAIAAEERVAKTKHTVMLGGGLVNLKAAFALLERGVAVTLVVYSPEVLSQLMEPKDALMIRQKLEDAGLKILTGRSVTKIIADDTGVKSVLMDNGQELSCEIVMIGKGVRPNSGFLESSGIKLDEGVVVDYFTRCNLPNVYAAGDVAVTFDPITGDRIMTGLWTNAVEMGRCAGRNMAGVATEYSGTFGIMNATEVAKLPFISMGIVHTQEGNYKVSTIETDTTVRKLVFTPEEDRLLGLVFIGEIANAGLYRLLIRERRDVTCFMDEILSNKLHYGHFLSQRVNP